MRKRRGPIAKQQPPFGVKANPMRIALSIVLAFSLAVQAPTNALAEVRETVSAGAEMLANRVFPESLCAQETVRHAGAANELPGEAQAAMVREGLCRDGKICISSYEQLALVGSGAVVTDADDNAQTVGTGAPVVLSDGSTLTYAADASYLLLNDIALPDGVAWSLPQNFSGSFTEADEAKGDSAEGLLYDEASDTIYLYHPYQLAVRTLADAASEPLMTLDTDPSTFGMGKPIYPAGGGVSLN